MTVTLPEFIQLTPEIQQDLRLAMREAVNKSALAVTQDARERVKIELGADQRLSGYLYNPTGSRVRVAGGRRINPAYKPAMSEEHPVALVGARGPAHLIEHNRRGDYDIKPRRRGRPSAAVQSEAGAFVQSMLGGPLESAPTAEAHAPALGRKGGSMFRAAVKGGFILRPLGGPIADAFRYAPRTVAQLAEQTVAARVNRMRY